MKFHKQFLVARLGLAVSAVRQKGSRSLCGGGSVDSDRFLNIPPVPELFWVPNVVSPNNVRLYSSRSLLRPFPQHYHHVLLRPLARFPKARRDHPPR